MNTLQNTSDSQEINFKYIFNTCLRNKKLFSTIIFISTFSTIIQSYFIKPTYLGTFDIVVKSESKDGSTSGIPDSIASYLPGNLKYDENETERLILLSPFVLTEFFFKSTLMSSAVVSEGIFQMIQCNSNPVLKLKLFNNNNSCAIAGVYYRW